MSKNSIQNDFLRALMEDGIDKDRVKASACDTLLFYFIFYQLLNENRASQLKQARNENQKQFIAAYHKIQKAMKAIAPKLNEKAEIETIVLPLINVLTKLYTFTVKPAKYKKYRTWRREKQWEPISQEAQREFLNTELLQYHILAKRYFHDNKIKDKMLKNADEIVSEGGPMQTARRFVAKLLGYNKGFSDSQIRKLVKMYKLEMPKRKAFTVLSYPFRSNLLKFRETEIPNKVIIEFVLEDLLQLPQAVTKQTLKSIHEAFVEDVNRRAEEKVTNTDRRTS